jgi:hypothetical protein
MNIFHGYSHSKSKFRQKSTEPFVYTASYLPGHGEILRLQRHQKIVDISLHYHNLKGGLAGVVHLYYLESIDLKTTDIIFYTGLVSTRVVDPDPDSQSGSRGKKTMKFQWGKCT